MTLRSLRTACQAILRIALCESLLLCAPLVIQAQTTDGTSMLDHWRTSFNQQLDDEIGALASSSHVQTISVTDMVPGEQNTTSSQTDVFSGSAYRRTGHWPAVAKGILQSQGLPVGLIGVVAIESGFNPLTLSRKGAAGLWQFMPGTARQYGLVVNASRDDRFDELKSTVAAARYLRQLYDQFGDWPLALAAYNAGPNRVGQGLARFHTHDFWTLSRDFALPKETLDYVPRVLAAMGGRPLSQNLELQRGTSWNWQEEAPATHVMHSNREGGIVFAITSPEESIPGDAK